MNIDIAFLYTSVFYATDVVGWMLVWHRKFKFGMQLYYHWPLVLSALYKSFTYLLTYLLTYLCLVYSVMKCCLCFVATVSCELCLLNLIQLNLCFLSTAARGRQSWAWRETRHFGKTSSMCSDLNRSDVVASNAAAVDSFCYLSDIFIIIVIMMSSSPSALSPLASSSSPSSSS